jgi:hypothetical protein
MKKNSFILAAVILIVAAAVYILNIYVLQKDGAVAVVTVDEAEIGCYALSEDQTVELNDGSNILVIQDGYADIVDANCPDRLCVSQKKISKSGESIICLPNKLVVSISGGETSDFDTISN